MIHTSNTAQPSAKTLIIRVSGPDACKFLQGQLTCDVAGLQNGQIVLGAYCNIKGKIDSLFYLEHLDAEYYLYLHRDLFESTMQELKKYGAFSKITLTAVEKPLPPIVSISDEDAIAQKIPQIYAATIGQFFPHDLNLPALGAVSFTKGCYRGQEIVARMQHRGKLKRSLYLFNCAYGDINASDIISTGELATAAGTVVRVCQTQHGNMLGLAVITDALVNETLSIGNLSVKILLGAHVRE